MRIARPTLRRALRAHARIETPAPSDSFVDALEHRLRGLDLSVSAASMASSSRRHLRRSLSRGTVIGVAAALVGGVSAFAVAIVANRSDDPPPIVTDTTVGAAPTSVDVPTTAPGPTSEREPESSTTTPTVIDRPPAPSTTTSSVATAVPATTTAPIATEPPAPPTVQPPIQPPSEPPVIVAETIAPVAPVAPETTAPIQASTTSSTEVHAPATLGLDCTMDSSAVRCNWTPGPDGTDHYVILRSSPSETRGRVLSPEPGTTTFVDVGVVPGNAYTYLVHALGASGASLAHSTPVTLACCG